MSQSTNNYGCRFAGLVDRFTLSTPYPLDEDTRATLVAGIKAAS
jgi:hypothetical protein